MAKYRVTLYYSTYIDVEVEAETREDAEDAAYCEAGDSKYDAQALHNIQVCGDADVEEISD